MEVRVVDGDGRLTGEPIRVLFSTGCELTPLVFLAQIKVADEWTLAGYRHRQQRVHHWMICRETGGAGIAADVLEPQALSLMQNDTQEAMTDRWRSDPGALLATDTRGQKGLDGTILFDDRQRSVSRSHQSPGTLDDLVQHRIERELCTDVQTGAMEGPQLPIVPRQPLLDPSDGPHQDAAGDEERQRNRAIEQETSSRRMNSLSHRANDLHQENADD